MEITAEQLWDVHRALAGGRSTITGQPLPATRYVQLLRGGHAEDVPVPPALSPESAGASSSGRHRGDQPLMLSSGGRDGRP